MDRSQYANSECGSRAVSVRLPDPSRWGKVCGRSGCFNEAAAPTAYLCPGPLVSGGATDSSPSNKIFGSSNFGFGLAGWASLDDLDEATALAKAGGPESAGRLGAGCAGSR